MSKFWRAVSLGNFLLGWLASATRDGEITLAEAAEGLAGALDAAGISARLRMPDGTVQDVQRIAQLMGADDAGERPSGSGT